MDKIAMHANRNLRPRTLASGDRRGLANYFAFAHGAIPIWWNEELAPNSDRVIGVFENVESSPEDAILITEHGLTILGAKRWSVRFDQIKTFDPPRKEPLASSVVAFLDSGEVVEIPVRNPPGAAFGFYRFLLYAVREQKVNRVTSHNG
jgi:hypothetical protein